jgi:hypothetical protein
MSAKVIRFPLDSKRPTTAGHQPHDDGVTCDAHLERHYRSRRDAHDYLSSRGFLFLPFGWANGRWRARIDMRGDDFVVVVSMTTATAA